MSKIIKPYEVISQLGQGGMGVVYKARSITLKNKVVAIKQLWPQYNNNTLFVKSFLEEGEKLFNLDHRNIVKVSDILEEDGEYFIVMEYIEGRTLSEIIKREVGPIHRPRAIMLFRQILEGVAYIHSQPKPIIHRDLKPLNILVTSDDIVKITDFGIAKELEDGEGSSTTMKGTPTYMSPEQIMDPKSVDIRTDIYSLGMTFYEMLCGKTPFSYENYPTPTAIYTKVTNEQVPPPTHFYPNIPESLVEYVMISINKDRNKRFRDAREMLLELEAIQVNTENSNAFNKVTRDGSQTENAHSSQNLIEVVRKHKQKRVHFLQMFAFVVLVILLTAMILIRLNSKPDFVGILMVPISGGSFTMGNDANNFWYDDESPKHSVKIASFYISKYEITSKEWFSVMDRYSELNDQYSDSAPINSISWFDAIEFCNKLSEWEGYQSVYKIDGNKVLCNFKANGYRLPTEAEWEFAARGGYRSRNYTYSGSNNVYDVAWPKSTFQGRFGTETVGPDEPYSVNGYSGNELGLIGMSGNVWEWCWDWYGNYDAEEQDNPQGPKSGHKKVIRGGSWADYEQALSVTNRLSYLPSHRNNTIGFRVVRSAE